MRQILFCRAPIPGRVKTRLASLLGDEGAAAAYRQILTKVTESFSSADTVLYVDDASSVPAIMNLFPQYDVCLQHGAHLGERMAEALIAERSKGYDEVLLAGTDVPDYDRSIAETARQALQTHDVVFGPASDGGYYLVGIRTGTEPRLLRLLFEGVSWSTSRTLEEQKHRALELGLRTALVETFADIDNPRDLSRAAARHGFAFPDIRAVIPVLNEEATLGAVLSDLNTLGIFREIICADNGSTDQSRNVALRSGARVTQCRERGYGATCLEALRDIRERGGCDVVLFLDADGSDDPEAILPVCEPVVSGRADLALGARTGSLSEPGAVPPHARFGNWLASALMRIFAGGRFTDLGPLRAVRWQALETLDMDDRNFGWTIQMQMRALQRGLEIVEVPVRARKRRGGKSKVSATMQGSIRAGYVILRTVLRETVHERKRKGQKASVKK
ncbi:MAG: TIGR04282 family arsenosugar biosynthesis glycosyltransferase [Spirochaetia bacterium]|nr:TIGR04282 family arsenosugar biosynthesis glycosyltransferase [Spirochaetia bacterium]